MLMFWLGDYFGLTFLSFSELCALCRGGNSTN